jgi:hypothetical protein
LVNYESNLPLFLPFAGVPEPAIDSPRTLELKRYAIAKSARKVPLLTEQDER